MRFLFRGNYSATSNNMKLVHWPLMGGLLHLVQRGGDSAGRSPPRSLLAVPNVTANPSMASVPISVLMNTVFRKKHPLLFSRITLEKETNLNENFTQNS